MDPEVTDGAAPSGAEDVKQQQLPLGDSSSSAEHGASGDSPPPTADSGASPAPAADKRPASSFEALMQAMKKPEQSQSDEPEGDSPAPEGKDAEAQGDEPEAEAEQQIDQQPDYEPVKKPRSEAERRLNQLLAERKEKLLPKAQTFDQLQEWSKANGLTPEHFMRSLELGVLTLRDPKKALEQLEPIRAELMRRAGVVDQLPDDLQSDVSEGRVTEERARELASLRLLKDSAERRAEETEQHHQARIQEARVSAIRETFTAFERRQAASDPDWSKKRSDVQMALKAFWAEEGMPATPEAAEGQAKKALAYVNQRWKELRPAKPGIDPKLNGASNPRNVVARPKTSLEALNAALNGQRVQY